jgi:hypothetical protein
MIDTALLLLRGELEAFITSQIDAGTEVLLENISLFESNQDIELEGVILSLVNIEEESTLKNIRAVRQNGLGGVEYANPPVFLNLYVLICSNFPGNYADSLQRLSGVIRFFQTKNAFTITNSPNSSVTITGDEPEDLLQLKLTLELYTLTFEQINHLWGALGGRQLPFVMYKVRLVSIYDRRVVREGAPIEIIENTVNHINTKP